MERSKLDKILNDHLHWIKQDCEGWESMRANLRRANLNGADLRGVDLSGADLSEADLCGAILRDADLSGADLIEADLIEASLIEADLREADLIDADFSGANLRRADLRKADLRKADLSEADLNGADLRGANYDEQTIEKLFPICCPDTGSFIGWKKAGGYIVKLLITKDAKRSSAFGRKCRCSKAKVLKIENIDGSNSGIMEISSYRDGNFIYRVGEEVEVADFDTNRINECAPGIHFFITRQEAVNY